MIGWLILLLLQVLPLAIASQDKFQQWFPKYRQELENVVSTNCSGPFKAYQAASGNVNKQCTLVVDCILAATRESQKANMASAAVLLGLTPTILTMLGCGTAEIALLSTRR